MSKVKILIIVKRKLENKIISLYKDLFIFNTEITNERLDQL